MITLKKMTWRDAMTGRLMLFEPLTGKTAPVDGNVLVLDGNEVVEDMSDVRSEPTNQAVVWPTPEFLLELGHESQRLGVMYVSRMQHQRCVVCDRTYDRAVAGVRCPGCRRLPGLGTADSCEACATSINVNHVSAFRGMSHWLCGRCSDAAMASERERHPLKAVTIKEDSAAAPVELSIWPTSAFMDAVGVIRRGGARGKLSIKQTELCYCCDKAFTRTDDPACPACRRCPGVDAAGSCAGCASPCAVLVREERADGWHDWYVCGDCAAAREETKRRRTENGRLPERPKPRGDGYEPVAAMFSIMGLARALFASDPRIQALVGRVSEVPARGVVPEWMTAEEARKRRAAAFKKAWLRERAIRHENVRRAVFIVQANGAVK